MQLRNIAIIAHVDHGKTTLVDRLLQQSGTLDNRLSQVSCIMDSNDLEKERGITILAKNTAIRWKNCRINIVDTPGHADFGGEVERILSMVDAVLLLVDAVDGPMPQTRFVTQKAFARGLHPIVVVNKVDREHAEPHKALDKVFDLFVELHASDAQLDFPALYGSGREGYMLPHLEDCQDEAKRKRGLIDLFETIVRYIPPPEATENGPFQFLNQKLEAFRILKHVRSLRQ